MWIIRRQNVLIHQRLDFTAGSEDNAIVHLAETGHLAVNLCLRTDSEEMNRLAIVHENENEWSDRTVILIRIVRCVIADLMEDDAQWIVE